MMNYQLQRKLSDSPIARWTALIIVAFTMMMGYYITYQMSPLESLLEATVADGGMNWTSTEYGFFSGSYGFINVFLLMLFFGGLILDKKGVRFTGLLACSLMVVGVLIMYYAVTYISPTEATYVNLPWLGLSDMMLKNQVIVSALGFAIFGVGNEMCGITVSKVMVKWFTGHEMALAMGIQVGLARLGTGAAMSVSLPLALRHSLSAPLMLSFVLICAALLFYIVYCLMDHRLEKSTLETDTTTEDEDGFRFSDILVTMKSPGFWLVTMLCLLFYSAMNPFFNFAPKLMMVKYGISADTAGLIPAIIPFGSIVLTPLFGTIYDRRGFGSTLIIIGTFLMVGVHVTFSLPFHSSLLAVLLMTILGLAFSLVPSALWPSVPKIIPLRRLGAAYGMIFFIQNIGLMVVRMLIGRINEYDSSYTSSMTVFALFGAAAFLSALLLHAIDKRKGYGLQKPNIKE